MNPLMSIFGNMGGGNNNIMLQAIGAMMRGETPQSFMRNLANTNPALKGLNLDDMKGTAQKLCNDKGVDINTAIQKVSAEVNANK